MARIRSVHPGLWTDETFVGLPAMARLFLIGLWNEADDNGVFQWKPLTLKMRILPGDNADASELLAIMAEAGVVMRYEAEGSSFGAVRNFRRFQRPERPKPVHPITDEVEQFVALPSNSHTCSKKKHGAVGDQAPTKRQSFSHQEVAEQPSLNDGSVSEHRQNTELHGPMEEGIGKVIHSSLRSECESAPEDATPAPPKTSQRRKSQLPEDWQPSPDELSYAKNLGLDGRAVAENFRLHWRSKGETKLDWHAAFQLWCRREQSFTGGRPAGTRFVPRPKTAAQNADENARYLLERFGAGQ